MDPRYHIGTPEGNFGDLMKLLSRLRLPSSFDRDLTLLTFSMSSRRVMRRRPLPVTLSSRPSRARYFWRSRPSMVAARSLACVALISRHLSA